jgi:transglutaminase-like putative cysteine protease
VIYNIRHLTAYSYDRTVASARLVLRVTPRDESGQRRLTFVLNISPPPLSVDTERDFYGNTVNVVTIDAEHKELSIEAVSTVELTHQAALPLSGEPWEEVSNAALLSRDLTGTAPVHFMFTSPRVQLSPDVTQYARDSFKPGRGILEASRDLIKRIRTDFDYEPETTDINTPLTEAFAQRQGVCQDFAHIMIAGLRGLGLPAAYVSGYIRTIPPPGEERLEGADATHAWVAVWCGSSDGWFGFDPTNAIDVGNDHIALAVGRDYSDVSPVYGVFVGSGGTELDVEVDVVPVTAPAPEARAAKA